MYIHADVPETFLSSVKKGRKVKIYIPVLDTTVNSTVDKVSNYISPENRTFKIEINVPNHSEMIKPNLTTKLLINDYTKENAILIPQSIISENSEGKQYVYKVNNEGKKTKVEKVFISTGKMQGDYIEVNSGLAMNDGVIQEGARVVKDGQEVNVKKEKDEQEVETIK